MADAVPNFTTQNPLVYHSLPVLYKEIELFTTLNSFVSAVKTYRNSFSIRISGGGMLQGIHNRDSVVFIYLFAYLYGTCNSYFRSHH